MILTWHRPDEPGVVYVKATVDGISEYVMPEWIPVLLDRSLRRLAPVQALRTAAAARGPGAGDRLPGHALLPLRHDGAEPGDLGRRRPSGRVARAAPETAGRLGV